MSWMSEEERKKRTEALNWSAKAAKESPSGVMEYKYDDLEALLAKAVRKILE